MVDEDCDVEWLARHLATGVGGVGGGGEEGEVMVLDCRSLTEFRAGHITDAIHLTVPTLMLRRLRTGCLPAESVINCLDARERFTSHWKARTLVVYGGSAEEGSNRTEADHRKDTKGYFQEGAKNISDQDAKDLVSLLVNRLKEDGCKVRYLKGGFAAFNAIYPQLCVASADNETTIFGLGCLRLSETASADSVRDPGSSSDPISPDNASHFPVKVLPNLYLGNAKNSADFEHLYKNGIKYILNVTPNVPNKFENSDQFQYLQLPICDHWSQNMTSYFPQAIAFIEEARRKKCGVLVHCLAGISRSVTITVAYLMHSMSLSLNDAYDHVKRCKPNISPNFNFMGQLVDYERALRLERSSDVPPPPGECCCCCQVASPSSECSCQLMPAVGKCRCHASVSSDSGGEDLSAPCACVNRLAHFASPASSSLSSFSTGATSSSSTSSSAFSYEISPLPHT